MTASENSGAIARRNRIIAIAAGVVTVTAVVLSLASGSLGLGWQWMRPAGELILLAELVGLIVLERHQLFEPVSERITAIGTQVGANERVRRVGGPPGDERCARSAQPSCGRRGQVAAYVGAREVLRVRTRLLREASSGNRDGPQMMRLGNFSGRSLFDDPRGGSEMSWKNGTSFSPNTCWC